jgi:hypothetical protein
MRFALPLQIAGVALGAVLVAAGRFLGAGG